MREYFPHFVRNTPHIGLFALSLVLLVAALTVISHVSAKPAASASDISLVHHTNNEVSYNEISQIPINLQRTTPQLLTTDTVSVTLVSYNPQGQQMASREAAISGNGQVIAFIADSNVFVYDRVTGQTALITKIPEGTPPPYGSLYPTLSFDGRYIAFESRSTNLDIPDDPNGSSPNVLVYDRINQKYTLIYPSMGDAAYSASEPILSANGRYIKMFVQMQRSAGTYIYDLNQSDNPLSPLPKVGIYRFISAGGQYLTYFINYDVFLHDRSNGTNELISVNMDGGPGDGTRWSQLASVSSDGNYVAFSSASDRLVPNDQNKKTDIFLRIRDQDQTLRLSTALDGSNTNNDSDNPVISADGRSVVFNSSANNLVAGPVPPIDPARNYGHVYIYDRSKDTIERVSRKSDGQAGPYGFIDYNNMKSVISADGCSVVFVSDGLVSHDATPLSHDIYVRDLCLSDDDPGEPGDMTITGKVVDLDGKPMANVKVSAGLLSQATTNEYGEYTLTGLNSSTYTVTAEADYTIITPPPSVSAGATGVNFVACYSQELAREYAPLMFFNGHIADIYRPIAVDTPLKHSRLVSYETTAGIPVEQLIVTSPSITDLLQHNGPDVFIDFEGNAPEGMLSAYREFKDSTRMVSYARVYCPTTPHVDYPQIATVIQYWFFYYDNPWVLNHHEGDWEMIQILFNKDGLPQHGGYSQHFKGQRRPWADMRKIEKRPFVYVSKGGHGSYFRDSWWSYGGLDDSTTTMTEGLEIPVEMIPIKKDEDSWLYFNGHWGGFGFTINPWDNGPVGPRGRIAVDLGNVSLWNDPIEWFARLENYATSSIWGKISASSPLPINVSVTPIAIRSESKGMHMPDIEYITDTETLQHVAILHNPDPASMYKIAFTVKKHITNTTAPLVVIIHFPDFASNRMIEAHYILPIDWNIHSSAFVTLPFHDTREISIDIDEDGEVDQKILPSKFIENTLSNRILLPLILK